MTRTFARVFAIATAIATGTATALGDHTPDEACFNQQPLMIAA